MNKPQISKPEGKFAVLTGQPYLLLTLAPLLWAGNFVTGKLAVGHIDPQLLLLGRWLGASLVLLPLALPHLKQDWPQIRAGWVQLAIYGVIGFASFNFLIYSAALYTKATNIAIENASIPVFVFLLNFIIFRVTAKPIQLLGLSLTFLGVVWVATNGAPLRLLGLDINLGDGLVIIACFAYAIYSILLKYKPDIHWFSFMQVTTFFALLASLAFLALSGRQPQSIIADIINITPTGWLCVLYVMVFPSICAQLCFARGVELVGPNRASIFINLLPIMGTLLSILLLGETLQFYHAIAAIMVLCGILLSEYSVRRTP